MVVTHVHINLLAIESRSSRLKTKTSLFRDPSDQITALPNEEQEYS